MLISLVALITLTIGGFALTYLISDDESLMSRLAAGNVIGHAVCGTLAFALALVFGLGATSIVAALLITILPVVLLLRGSRRKEFGRDWARAKGKLQGANAAKFWRFAYYAFFLVLFLLFFDRAMMETPAGIFTGGSQNLGDLPFHLGAIYSFTDGANFPPQNPSFAGARFSYPFIADLLTAAYMKLGADVHSALFVQNVGWAFSLLVLLERFTMHLVGDKLAARIAPILLFFSGGLGFLWFLSDYWAQPFGLFDFLSKLPKDYTIGDTFRWGNSLVVLFMTQRSLLLGMPITLMILSYLWKVFAGEKRERGKSEKVSSKQSDKNLPSLSLFHLSTLACGAIAGTLGLIHLHSLAVLFVVGVCLLIAKPQAWKEWMLFAVGVAVIAIPEIAWSLSGSATQTSEFFGWHFGWDKREQNFLWFWLLNTGIFLPLLLVGIWRGLSAADGQHHVRSTRLAFYIPFAILFVVSNVAKLAPWEWDNIKVLIYWYIGSIPFASVAIAWLWRRFKPHFAGAAACIIVMTASGALDVWRTVSGQINYKIFDKDAVELGKRIRPQPEKDAIILNAPTYNTAAVLTGRISVMRYPGHLMSHGIKYAEREADVKAIYSGGATADSLLRKYNVSYVLISPEERSTMNVNEGFFNKFPVVAESGQYKVVNVR
jgi:hypothetical protein